MPGEAMEAQFLDQGREWKLVARSAHGVLDAGQPGVAKKTFSPGCLCASHETVYVHVPVMGVCVWGARIIFVLKSHRMS